MAITINFNGASLRKPGSYSKTSVNLTGGFPVAPAGIVGIVGEAEAGAPGSSEDIRENNFSPAQFADVVDKYKSGPIVDAFRLLVNPSNDARVANGANRVYIYKTNASTKASGTLPSAYGSISSKNYGLDENTINFQVSDAQSEQGPQMGSFNWVSDENSGATVRARVNGGAQQSASIAAAATPASFVSSWNGSISGILASGGASRSLLTGSDIGETLALSVSGAGLIVTIAISVGFSNTPSVGDTLYIPTGSVIAGGSNENVGGYVITSASNTSITAMKLSDTLTSAIAVGATAIVAASDLQAFAPVTLEYDASTPDGVGASVELYDGAGSLAFQDGISGGGDLGLISSTLVIDGSKLSLSIVSGANVTISIDSAFAALAESGDIVRIRPGSILAGAGNANVGNYLVTSASSNSISATKISGSPAAVSLTDIVAQSDLECFSGIISSAAVPLGLHSGLERKVTINQQRNSDSISEDSIALGGNPVLALGYDGTTATCTINSVNMVLTVTGGSGSSQTIPLSNHATIKALADYIDAQTGYSAAILNNVFASLPPSKLDRVSAVGIAEENAGSLPGRIKKDSDEIQNFFDSSVLTDLVRTSFVGLPAEMASPVFLSGGAKGGSSAASVSAGMDAMQKVRINSLVPLFSRDATSDILDELTEPSSTYQISAINAAAKSHCILMSNTLSRSERNTYCSIKDSYTNSKTESASLASERVSLALQDIKVLKTDGTLDWVQPWGMASVAAGMQAGAPIGEPMTFKFINVSGIRHSSFDPQTQADDAIDSGLLFAEQPEQGGFRMVLGNTTYGKDANFVYNRISVLYAADTVAYNLRKQLEAIFVGVGQAVADAQSIKNTCISILSTFLAAGLIVGDDTNSGTGFKNLDVRIEGNVAYVDVTITPVQGIDFILPSLVLDNIRQTA